MTKLIVLLVVCMVVMRGIAFGAGLPGDAEAATHGDEASMVQLVQETAVNEKGYIFRQYNLAVLSHYSYLLASGGEAMIVDPARDISRYLKDAAELGVKITRVYLTHSHADFVAGHMELAKATGAQIYINEETHAGYPHQPLKDGDLIKFGDIRGVLMKTPGHTPDGTCLAIYRPAAATEPEFVFTGDTLFIGSVGRPDLMGDGMSAAALAEMGYHTWRDKLIKLPDAARIFPAHGAGSLCGAHLSDKPVSTWGEQQHENIYLQHKDLHSYVMAVIDGLPDAPQYFKHNAKLNHDGPPLVDWENLMPVALTPTETARREGQGTWIIDVRDAMLFASGHPRGAINIGIRGRFETWTGIMIPWGEPFILAGSDDEVRESAFRLKRIGYDTPAGYLQGGYAGWKTAQLPTGSLKMVAARDLYQQMQSGGAPIVIDVRLPTEWMALRIGNVLNIPINKLFADAKRLDKKMPVLTVCNSAYRSSMGGSVLRKMGFNDVLNMEGGSEAWIAAGLPTISAAAEGHGQASSPALTVKLPDRMSPAELKRMIMDQPGTFEIVDIRPAASYADYNLPGSMNVEIVKVIANPSYLNGNIPLVIVDRDGSLAMAIGGILSQKSTRPVKVLYGGLDAYWSETGPGGKMTSPSQPVTAAPPVPVMKAAPALAPTTPVPAAIPPQPPKKKSAGC